MLAKTQPDSTCEYRTPTHCFPTAHFIPRLILDWVATAESLSLFLLNSVTAVRQVKKTKQKRNYMFTFKAIWNTMGNPTPVFGLLDIQMCFLYFRPPLSVHIMLPPHSAVYLTIVVFSVPPNRAFLSSGLTSRLSYCRNEWHSSVGCTSPRRIWHAHPERGLLKVSHSCQSH